ncbi:7401_t:CDS:2 [Gigaspora margarita]|uniref:7401_t:CDS:1 n=1 Tax=Gigaspora margarita TaxID=4874 RepID=A0ABM8W4P5_GIGMA|nr:7401_t:CDS:2 [Gigaspora margarita]
MEKICEIVLCQKEKIRLMSVATIAFVNNLHYLKKFNNYKHVPQASSAEVARIRRADMPLQPTKLDDIDISDSLSSTLSEEDFLVKDSVIEDKRILLFTTKVNMQHLSSSLYWMIVSTFKTILTIFCQLYKIHAPIGVENN